MVVGFFFPFGIVFLCLSYLRGNVYFSMLYDMKFFQPILNQVLLKISPISTYQS